MSEHPAPDQANPPAPDGLAAYVAALGVADPDAAATLAAALRARAAEDSRPAAVAALDAFLDQAVAHVAGAAAAHDHAPRRSPAAVRFTLARHLGPLLSDHPAAPHDPAAGDAFTAALAQRHDALPGGVLPLHPQQEMPRQPLGALPAVLRSQFWSSAYRLGPFGNRRNSAAADDSPRPAGVAEAPPSAPHRVAPRAEPPA